MHFRQMRRKNQKLNDVECREILQKGSFGVLALSGDEGFPYAVPLNYVFLDGALYFHCAKEGHKVDAVAHCDKASFCVVAASEVLPQKFTTKFKSVIAFGKVAVLQDPNEVLHAIRALALKYSPGESDEAREDEVQRFLPRLCMMKMDVLHLSGKQGKEFLNE